MRRSLGDGWSIELPGAWTCRSGKHGVALWRAPGRTMLVAPGDQWRCADGVDIIASLDAKLPPDPVGKVGEAGREGVGHRAAWLYRHSGEIEYALYGYNFCDGDYLETVFTGADGADVAYAIEAWRSVARSAGSLPVRFSAGSSRCQPSM